MILVGQEKVGYLEFFLVSRKSLFWRVLFNEKCNFLTQKWLKLILFNLWKILLGIKNLTWIFWTSCSVATKIENGPKTNTKNLRYFKNSSKIFADTKIFKGKWKIFALKNFLSGRNLNQIEDQSFKKSTYF